jgi:hypothetical protein
VVQDHVHQEGRPLRDTFRMEFYQLFDSMQRPSALRAESAHGDEEVATKEQVHLIDREFPIGVAESVEDDEGVPREILDLGNLVLIRAVLDRERMEAERIDEGRKLLLRRLTVIQPDETPALGRIQRLGQRGDASELSLPGDVIEAGSGHGGSSFT